VQVRHNTAAEATDDLGLMRGSFQLARAKLSRVALLPAGFLLD
jgi:hypothetical protein